MIQSTESANPLNSLIRPALIAGAAGLGLLLVGGVAGSASQAFRSYHLAYVLTSGFALGCLGILLLHHVVGGGWGFVIRRELEAGAMTLPLLAVLFLPIIVGLSHIYKWTDPNVIAHSDAIRHKVAYLNPVAFGMRTATYFTLWITIAALNYVWSSRQDDASDPTPTRRRQLIAPLSLVLLFLSGTFAAIDWMMSLEPDWASTMYGPMAIVGQGLAAYAFTIALAARLADRSALGLIATPERFHDLGNLLLTFVMFWAYMSFSQYLIIYAGNLQEEIPWYLRRTRQGWQYVGIALMLFQFFLPFFVLLFREAKTSARLLRRVALLVVVFHVVDVFWLIKPAHGPMPLHVHWLDIAAIVGVGGVWLGAFAWLLGRRPLVPRNDPVLAEVLQHSHASEHERAFGGSH